jgi:hypothetical protein
MSISNLMSGNEYNLFSNSLTTDILKSTGDNDLKIQRNGSDVIVLTKDASGNPQIDFKSVPVVNFGASVISDLGADVIIDNSIQVGTGATGTKPRLYLTGAGNDNLVINAPSGRQTNLSVNGVAQAYVDENGLNIPSGSLYIAGNGYNITQLSGNGLYRCPAGTSHQFQVNAVNKAVVGTNGIDISGSVKIGGVDAITNTRAGSFASVGCVGDDDVSGNLTVYGTTNINNDAYMQQGYLWRQGDATNNWIMTTTAPNVIQNTSGTVNTYKFQVASADKLKLDASALTSYNTSTVLGSGNASAVTITQDGTNTLYNVPTSKKHKFQANGVDVLTIDGNYTTGNLMILGIGGSNPTTKSSTCGLRSNNGICATNDLYIGGQVKAEMNIGSGYGFITSAPSSNPLITLSASLTSNTTATILMKPNYTGTVLGGFQNMVQYGDDSGSSNRNNSTLYTQQYIGSVNGGATVNAYETRVSYGARREVRFSTTGSGTNDIVFDGTNATFSGVNVAIGSGKSLTLLSDLATKPTTNTWTISSDARLKQNIEDVASKDALSAITNIRVRKFDYIDGFKQKYGLADHKKVGVVAQELETAHELLAPCVSIGEDEVFYEEKDETYVDDITGQTLTRKVQVETSRVSNRKQLNMDRVNYLMIGAITELAKQNNYLLTKLKAKEEQLIEINDRLNALESNVQTVTNVDTFDSVSYSGNVPDNFSALG